MRGSYIIDKTYYPSSRLKWRQWLQRHHRTNESIWMICYKKSSGRPTVEWSQAVDEALCFGWIDSVRKSVDEEKYVQRFSKRKPKSVWSKINKRKVKLLTHQGLMAAAGLECVAIAKRNGSWTKKQRPSEALTS